MGLVYEDERYFSACDVKKFDAEKFDRFVDNLAHDIDRYIGDARALETGYGKYYNNSTYVGKAATASKEFIDRKQFEKFHVGSKDIQRELFNRCLGVKNMFEARYNHIDGLVRMGAQIRQSGRVARVSGTDDLHGAAVRAGDLRAGAALITAALGAQGETRILDRGDIDRGYASIEKTLAALGADIQRV